MHAILYAIAHEDENSGGINEDGVMPSPSHSPEDRIEALETLCQRIMLQPSLVSATMSTIETLHDSTSQSSTVPSLLRITILVLILLLEVDDDEYIQVFDKGYDDAQRSGSAGMQQALGAQPTPGGPLERRDARALTLTGSIKQRVEGKVHKWENNVPRLKGVILGLIRRERLTFELLLACFEDSVFAQRNLVHLFVSPSHVTPPW